MILVLVTSAPAADDWIADTRTAMEKWVETRRMISRVKSDWAAERETLQQTVELFEKDLANFQELIGGVETGSQQVDKERAEQETRKQELVQAGERLQELLALLESKVIVLAKRLPPPLTELPDFGKLVSRIPVDPVATKLPVSARLQTLVAILNEADKFNGAINVVPEIRQVEGGAEVQVKTLYLGLGQAWYVDPSGKYAGTGTPGTAGWDWTASPALAARITKAIAVYENAQPAAFVSLPAKIQ